MRGAQVITMDERDHVAKLDIRIEGNRITAVGPRLSARGLEVVEARGLVALPGLIQAHVHLCQTLMRNQPEGLDLLGWLRERIWPLEGAMTASDMKHAARLGIAELLLSGTTTILDFGSVRHTDELFGAASRLGIRYTGGKAIMDHGQGYPASLRESTEQALDESLRLAARWHGEAGGRLRYAFSPRFLLSCTETSLRACAREARARGMLIQTHAAESSEEVALIRERTGHGNVEHLHALGLSGPHVVLAHGVWLSSYERRLLRETKTRLVHCPSANLKLGSGIARVPELLDEGVVMALGCDGAACNDSLDAFLEMRLTALIHKARHGPGAIPAHVALGLATRDGARALGLETGVIAPGKLADIILLDLARPHAVPAGGDLCARVVFTAKSSDVHTVIVDGKVLVAEGELAVAKVSSIVREAARAGVALHARTFGQAT